MNLTKICLWKRINDYYITHSEMETLFAGTKIYSVYRPKESEISLRSKAGRQRSTKVVSKLIANDFDIKYWAGWEN